MKVIDDMCAQTLILLIDLQSTQTYVHVELMRADIRSPTPFKPFFDKHSQSYAILDSILPNHQGNFC